MTTAVNYWDLDHQIVYGFLLLTLFYGLYVGRNNKDITDYAIAGKSYGTSTLVLTLLATQMGGGSTVGNVQNIFSDGIIMALVTGIFGFSYLFVGLWVAPRIVSFEGSITLGDIMSRMYGRDSKWVVGIIGATYSIIIVAAQMLTLGYICEYLLHLDKGWSIIMVSAIIIVYSAFGGMKSVAKTDVAQFAVLIVMIPILSSVVTAKAGGISEIYHKLPASKLQIFSNTKYYDYI